MQVKFREWNALLAKVYCSAPEDEELFIKHTYLTMVSRAIVKLALFRAEGSGASLYRGLMNGDFFRQKSIQNLAEPDFFSWGLGTAAECEGHPHPGLVFQSHNHPITNHQYYRSFWWKARRANARAAAR
ncbi:MAG TPA: hypothetical protein VFZ08_12400 [Terriglobia bacterium]|nr:hypothetical protein [Terriglobia bacterium]